MWVPAGAGVGRCGSPQLRGAQLCTISHSCGPRRLHLPAGGGERGWGWEARFPLLLPRDGGRTVHADGCCEYHSTALCPPAALGTGLFLPIHLFPLICSLPRDPTETRLHPFIFQELFKKVVPYHCLGCIWSQRDKKGKEHLAPTIRATVSQFNSVANCVIVTCLGDRSLKPQQRAKVVERWIEVARVGQLAHLPPRQRAEVLQCENPSRSGLSLALSPVVSLSAPRSAAS